MGRGKSPRTIQFEKDLHALAAEHEPITIRGLFYRAVSAKLIDAKNDNGYQKVQKACMEMREDGSMPITWFIDEGRECQHSPGWDDPLEILESSVWSYRLNRWQFQPKRVEVWVEKDAVKSIVEPITSKWQVPLYSCRGNASLTMTNEAYEKRPPGKPWVILYFGDHDPEGRHIPVAIKRQIGVINKLNRRTLQPTIRWCGITLEQIAEHDLLMRPTKEAARNKAAFFAAFGAGAESCELDALAPADLKDLVDAAIESEVDMDKWNEAGEREMKEKAHLRSIQSELRRLAE